MAFAFLRFVILQTVLAAGLVALYLKGPLQAALAGEAGWYVGGVLIVGMAGLALVSLGRISDAAKVMLVLPILAVFAMQGGIFSALSSLGPDPTKAAGIMAAAISKGLIVSMTALGSYLWLIITMWLSHGR